MPKTNKEDGEATTKAILSMRGADKKKHKLAWEEGSLKLAAKRLPMQGKVQAWRIACGQGEKWNEMSTADRLPEESVIDR